MKVDEICYLPNNGRDWRASLQDTSYRNSTISPYKVEIILIKTDNHAAF